VSLDVRTIVQRVKADLQGPLGIAELANAIAAGSRPALSL